MSRPRTHAGRAFGGWCAILLASGSAGPLTDADVPTTAVEENTPFTRLYDTGMPAAAPLTREPVAPRAGWKLVPEEDLTHRFAGDAVVLNDKLAVALRHRGQGAEVFTKTDQGWALRARIGCVGQEQAATVGNGGFRIVENTTSAVALETAGTDPGAPPLSFRLTAGEAILELRGSESTVAVDVQSAARYVVVPDYFGDDAVYRVAPGRRAYLPAENMCLSLIEGVAAILMSVWESNQQEAWLEPATAEATAGPPGNLSAGWTHHRIRCLKDKRIWLAWLESPAIWHAGTATTPDTWQPPFAAKWRCSLVRGDGVADSWDRERGPRPEQAAQPEAGVLLEYALDRSAATPLTVNLPTDVMRNTLGVGPCQYILACEGLGAQGDPTPNAVMTWVERQFEQKKEKKAAEDIQERLDVMVSHVAEAHARLRSYEAFAGDVQARLASQAAAHPLRLIADELARSAAAGLTVAASPERARQLANDITGLLGKENSLPACQRAGEQLRTLGATQDRALAKCRMAVRRLKQEARAFAASTPAEAETLREVQQRAEQMLSRKPTTADPKGGSPR